LYKILAENHKNDVDWHRVIVVQMDEYWGIRPEDPQSMWYSIEHGLVSPLGITQFLKYFDGRGALIRPITEYEQTINTLGGIDLIIHGMGRNGHIGFCEPGMPWDAPTQKVRLADSTLAANFGDDSALRENYHDGVTLGLAVLTAARHALLLLTGDAKDDAARAFFHKPPSVAIPASSVVRNPSVDCVVDASTISLG
jgi:glucosamine-6-phosphate deaminase